MRSISVRMDKAEREVASGKRVTVASDDPDALSNLMQAPHEPRAAGSDEDESEPG